MPPLLVLNTIGLTSRLLPQAPRLATLAKTGWQRPLTEVIPAVTCTAQATLLTGALPQEHGIVGNGWLWRDTAEVRFWQQSNRLIEREPLYVTARKRATECGRRFRCAKLFWWFNQGAQVESSVTPKPHYGADGNKVFDVLGTPVGLAEQLKFRHGPFPFSAFWGPMAGLPATEWIANISADIVTTERPDLTLVYLPHLDYDPQRLGPGACDWPRLLRELDDACDPLLNAAHAVGAEVWVVNEYTHVPVSQAVLPNRVLRQAKLLQTRYGPFGEMLDTYESRAFAVCDHQLAHVYVNDPADLTRVRDVLAAQAGVARVVGGEARAEFGLDHPRAGDLVALAKPDAWFAYPYWLDDRLAPDFARTVNIHAKPGYDPCELFFDPKLWWPKLRAVRRLLQKKLGFRTLFDVVPLDASLVRGSHGLRVAEAMDRPVLIGHGSPPAADLPMTAVRDLLLTRLDLV